jgi:hypothetical protein
VWRLGAAVGLEEFYHQLYTQHYHLAGQDDPLLEQATLDAHTGETKLREAATLRLNEIEEFAPLTKPSM